jgi:hypothetical protein
MSSNLTPRKRGLGNGIRYAVSLPGSRVCRNGSVEDRIVMLGWLLDERLRVGVSNSKPASRAFVEENDDPGGELTGFRAVCEERDLNCKGAGTRDGIAGLPCGCTRLTSGRDESGESICEVEKKSG